MTESPEPPKETQRDGVTRWAALGVMALCAALLWARWRAPGVASSAALGPALQAVEARLRARQWQASLARLERDCQELSCACALASARAAFDVDAPREASRVLTAARGTCSVSALAGPHAELLARQGESAMARAAAERALLQSPADGCALYALAWELLRAGQRQQALGYAMRSTQAGRGSAAIDLEGTIAYGDGQLVLAASAFQRAVELEPNDVDALYNSALVAQRQNRYRDARENYLKVTRLDPKHQNARYNLAILTQSVGAQAEARHHLERFAELAPADTRVASLRALIERTPSTAGTVGSSSPAPSAR